MHEVLSSILGIIEKAKLIQKYRKICYRPEIRDRCMCTHTHLMRVNEFVYVYAHVCVHMCNEVRG